MIMRDPQLQILEKIEAIKEDLEKLEEQVILRAKLSIDVIEQENGKLIRCLPSDA
jgi:hypothetical protein